MGELKQLSGQDNSFLEIEKLGLPQHIASVAIYDQSTAPGGIVRFKQILGHLESRLHLSPLFRMKLHPAPMDLDRPYLVDDEDFDLEYHVRHIALPQPGDWRQLCILIARINARALDLSRPLWELYVIEGLGEISQVPPGSFAILHKIHHSVMDGASAVEMQAAIHDFGSEPRAVEPEKQRVVHTPPTPVELGLRAYVNALRKPRRIFNLVRRIVGQQNMTRRLPQAERGVAGERKVKTRFNGKISPHRVLDSITLDFAEVRAIKNEVPGATINDAMLAIVSGALRKYLESIGELPEESLTCGCPIDVRDPSERGTGGNVIGFMGVMLRTDVADPMDRLRAVHEAAVEAKADAQASDVRIPLEFMEAVPSGIMTTAMRVQASLGLNATPFNTMLTNIPGTSADLYFAGAQSVEGFGIGPLVPGVSLFHTATSVVVNKKGRMLLSFWACRDAMPNPDVYRQCIVESYEELRGAALSPVEPK
ncbi:MAG: wax ester/triacylglycerol synthase family O-acyltransferase [bacterium]|nr:wax ester/triacylglycerol synthase family O-acyltransferase [Deltaproteobacteria bacterium]MCP4907837.1 wax ester/triacylglycerol synthase family O-acyltransferase [bacterium]